MGCGWLGLPLAMNLVEKGYTVRGTTTSDSKVALLKENGIEPHLISLGEEGIEGDINSFLKGMDAIVINVPPALRKGIPSNYVQKIRHLLEHIRLAGITEVIFVSSTSVYGPISGNVTEKTTPKPNTESGRQLLDTEQLIRADQSLRSSIIRFGGLIGPGRHPVNFLSGRNNLKNGHHPVNLIHLDDCMSIILAVLEEGWWDTLFNGVYPEHPSKKDYYSKIAANWGLQAPEYVEDADSSVGKLVESSKLSERGFTFRKGIPDS